MGAKRYEMRSPEDRRRRQAATAAQGKCRCGNVLGQDNRSGSCGACNPGDETKEQLQTFFYTEELWVVPQEVQAKSLGHALQKIAACLGDDTVKVTVWRKA